MEKELKTSASVSPEEKTEVKVSATPAQAPTTAPVEKSEIEILKQQIADMQKMLLGVADKNKLEAFNEKQRDRSQKTIHVSFYEGQYVVQWSDLSKNRRVKKDGEYIGEHETTLTFLDGTDKVVDYCTWQKDKTLVESIVEEETKDKYGEITYSVITKDGTKLKINSRFIN